MRKGIIALDLDGTLLNSQKQLSDRNLQALQKAAEAGWEIVPSTGRFFGAMPEIIRQLPFVRYAITINGAEAIDGRTGQVIYHAEMPWQQAVEIMKWMDTYPVIYDCYLESSGWMTAAQKEQIDQVVESPHTREMIHRLRKPVEDLKTFVTEKQQPIQKVQFFAADEEIRLQMMAELPERFQDIIVSSALPQNVEINQIHANKGEALLALAEHLGMDKGQTVAFGDGLNDVPMLKAAGLGIAMENGYEETKAAADRITLSCDEDGVAAAIERILEGR